jgi:hypothetical protein
MKSTRTSKSRAQHNTASAAHPSDIPSTLAQQHVHIRCTPTSLPLRAYLNRVMAGTLSIEEVRVACKTATDGSRQAGI